jgi:hypothetical protein
LAITWWLLAADQFRRCSAKACCGPRFLKLVSFGETPSIFHFHYSDRFRLGHLGRVGLAVLALTGLRIWGLVHPDLVWLLLWVLYLSVVNVGQTFYGFGWNRSCWRRFLAIFLGPVSSVLFVRPAAGRGVAAGLMISRSCG